MDERSKGELNEEPEATPDQEIEVDPKPSSAGGVEKPFDRTYGGRIPNPYPEQILGADEPPLAVGSIRLYRGEIPRIVNDPRHAPVSNVERLMNPYGVGGMPAELRGRFFARVRRDAENYARSHPGGTLLYVDVPDLPFNKSVEKYGPFFVISLELLADAKQLPLSVKK